MGWKDRKNMYVSGVPAYIGNKIVEYAFGGWLHEFKANPENGSYDIWLYSDVNMKVVKRFKEYWGDGWRITLIELTESK